MTVKPKAKAGVLARRMDDECLLYDEERGRVHVLNGIAGFVWELCDGTNGLGEMERRVREAYDVPPSVDLSSDIERFVTGLTELELVAFPGDPT